MDTYKKEIKKCLTEYEKYATATHESKTDYSVLSYMVDEKGEYYFVLDYKKRYDMEDAIFPCFTAINANLMCQQGKHFEFWLMKYAYREAMRIGKIAALRQSCITDGYYEYEDY